MARRRAELHLSKAQVAARAGMSLRYLEYVERYPARPGFTALRRLAAALQTTPAALLGAGAQAPPGYGRTAGPPIITKLVPAECRRLIAAGGIGRIAFGTTTGPAVAPGQLRRGRGTLVIRTGEGTVIDDHADGQAAFEVDHIDEALARAGASSCAARRTASRIRPSSACLVTLGLAVARRRPRRLRAYHPGHHHRPPDREPLTPGHS